MRPYEAIFNLRRRVLIRLYRVGLTKNLLISIVLNNDFIAQNGIVKILAKDLNRKSYYCYMNILFGYCMNKKDLNA